MDSITQIALGAAVGEATLGNKIGRKAAIWGGILGTLPDLDILSGLWLDSVDFLATHRSGSHSLIIATIVAPLIGFLLSKIYGTRTAKTSEWVLMVWLVGITHILLDLLTVYGTQIFWPLSRFPFSFDSVFIIDLLYTLPLIVGVLWALRLEQGSKKRFNVIAGALIISSLYLTWGMGAKAYVHSSFKQGFASRGVLTQRLLTTPTPLNSILWMGLGQQGDSIHVGLYSILDSNPPAPITTVPRNTHLLENHFKDRAVERLLWFSKGWYSVEEDSSGLIFSDLRFGRSDSWMEDDGEAVFRFKLIETSGRYETFTNLPRQFENPANVLRTVARRAMGSE